MTSSNTHSPGQHTPSTSLLRQLAALRWCPVLRTPPSSILPYSDPPTLPVATPPTCRPPDLAPYTSATFFTLGTHVSSHVFLRAMGWAAPPSAPELAA